MLTLDAIKQSAYSLGVIPVIRIEDAALARPLAEALTAGGLPAAEVTFRTAAAADAIAAMREAFPDMLICAGTVLTKQQADDAVRSGASFVVSPGLNPEVVTHCLEHDIPIIPGCATPSDIERALSLGLDTVKFCPAEANGGIAAIKAIAAPYGQVSFMPTGGINAVNLSSYLAFKKVLCCGGSFMVPGSALAAADFATITALTCLGPSAEADQPFPPRRRRRPFGAAGDGWPLSGLYNGKSEPSQRLSDADRHPVYPRRRCNSCAGGRSDGHHPAADCGLRRNQHHENCSIWRNHAAALTARLQPVCTGFPV